MESRLIFLRRVMGDVVWIEVGALVVPVPQGRVHLMTKLPEAQSRKATRVEAHDRTKTDTGRRGE